MVSSLHYVLLALGCLDSLVYHAAAQKVVRMSLKTKNRTRQHDKRDPFAISMQNYIPGAEYYVTATIGTPAQDIEFVVDTGSSDIWMFGPNSCQQGTSICEGGEFDITSSSTAQYVPGGQGAFSIRYVTRGSGVVGDYFTDVFGVGGETVKGLTMAVATRAAYVPSGIMGIGLSMNEAIVSRGGSSYPNFPDLLVAQNKISTKAYSLYLDDIASSTGMMVFGGYDEAKFRDNIIMLPIQPDAFNGGKLSSFAVAWSSLGWSDKSGDYTIESAGDFLYAAVLDTGTTLTYMPSEIYAGLESYFGVTSQGRGQPGQIDCDFGKKNPGQLIYGFGGPTGPEIAVEFDELVVPVYNNGHPVTYQGSPVCAFGIVDAGNSPILFGQTFLRSAYVLYDLDNMQVGIAQTVFDSTKSSVQEYSGPSGAKRITTLEGLQVPPTRAGAGSGAASAIPTEFNIASVPYPSADTPATYPTTLPMGPTGVIPLGGNGGGSGNGGRSTSTTSSAPTGSSSSGGGGGSSSGGSSGGNSGGSSGGSSSGGSSSGGNGGGNNAATAMSPALGAALVSLLALVSAMLLL